MTFYFRQWFMIESWNARTFLEHAIVAPQDTYLLQLQLPLKSNFEIAPAPDKYNDPSHVLSMNVLNRIIKYTPAISKRHSCILESVNPGMLNR